MGLKSEAYASKSKTSKHEAGHADLKQHFPFLELNSRGDGVANKFFLNIILVQSVLFFLFIVKP